jgi:hypothetical protein
MNGEFRRADVDIFFFLQEEIQRGEWAKCECWLQSRSLSARGRVGLEVHRCLFIIDAGNVLISTKDSRFMQKHYLVMIVAARLMGRTPQM